jgi:hypothetical protein
MPIKSGGSMLFWCYLFDLIDATLPWQVDEKFPATAEAEVFHS